MLMQPEAARQLQIDVLKQKEADELEGICKRIQENLERGNSTLIHKTEVNSKDVLKAIEKMGYTVIDSDWYDPGYYLITVDQKEIREIKQHILRMKVVPILAMIIAGMELFIKNGSILESSMFSFLGDWFLYTMILYFVSAFVIKAKWRS